MKTFLKNNFYFILIFAGYLVLSFLLVGRYDYAGDSSLYSVRAFGWIDYLGEGQKGVVEWLGHSTWWSGLSFQDAPPVVFGLQYIFFRILGESIISVQILYLLVGLILIGSIYFYIKNIVDTETALWASGALSVSSLMLWSNLSGNLEAIESLFITLSFLTLSVYIKYKKDFNFYLAIFFTALAVMSKYTAIFIIPSLLLSLYSFESNKVSYKKYIYGFFLFVLMILPTAVYNFYLYKNRGNFDTALSAIVGMDNELGRSANFDFTFNSFGVISTLFQTSSFLYMALCLVGFIFLAVKSQNKKSSFLEYSLVIYIFLFFIMLGFMGGAARWLPIFMPFFSIAVGLFIVECRKKYKTKSVLYFIVFILIFEMLYSINTNILYRPIGKVGVFSSSIRNSSGGFNQLEDYLNSELSPLPKRRKIYRSSELKISSDNIMNFENKIIMFDGRINWFARRWYIEKYFLYYKIPVFSFDNNELRHIVFPKNEIINSILKGSGKSLYFIEAVNPEIMNFDTSNNLTNIMNIFSEKLINSRTLFFDVINQKGDVAFRVYKIQF